MENIDKVANQMTIAALTGLGAGAGIAIYKGRPILRLSVQVAFSWALVGTALFGIERIADISARQLLTVSKTKTGSLTLTDDSLRYATYSIGGLGGGALVGFIHHRRIMPGVLFFTPVMLFFAFAEKKYIAARRKHLDDEGVP
jgi:hypothetical protein